MSKTSTKKYKYSKLQYFFWLLSGAEISILKECPTDYNRQAGIGFTIFMTTLLAFFLEATQVIILGKVICPLSYSVLSGLL